MSDRRKQPQGRESMSVHSEQKRNYCSKPLVPTFSLLPPRPRSCPGTRIPAPLGLQVQGFCCSIQQRPHSGRVTHRVTPQSRGAADRRLTPLSSVKRAQAGRTKEKASGADAALKAGGRTVRPPADPVSETAELSTVSCSNERQAHHMQPGGLKATELHLYLPSSVCENEEPSSDEEEMR